MRLNMFSKAKHSNSKYVPFLTVALMLLGAVLICNASYIHLKAHLAQMLIASAYNKQIASNEVNKPWPWADTSVLGRLEINGQTDYILANASMRNLAFGPAHLSQTTLPGEIGNSVIVGHRDTHFKHLSEIKIGQIIVLNKMGINIQYRVEELAVIDATQMQVLNKLPISALTLITCYPFNSVSPNPKQRFVVRAIKT